MTVFDKSNTCILIPAYNEEKNITHLLRALLERGYTVIVSDDGSEDRTVSVSRSSGAQVISSEKNMGKGASLRRGLRWFLKQNHLAVVLMDADGQHDPQQIGLFLEALNRSGTDMIIGNRMSDPKGMPWIRVATNRVMSWAISLLAGQKIFDSQCGYRALKREVVEKMTLRTSRFEIESEMILEASRLGFKISSVPIASRYEGGNSHIHPLRDTYRFFKFMLAYVFFKK